MKKFNYMLIVILFIGVSLLAQSIGKLNVSVTTSSTGGKFAPRHILAIWIEDDSGDFVKTLLAYASKRKTHLNNWQKSTNDAGSEYNTIDAITGATRSSHKMRNCTWDGTDFNGVTVPDGNYKLLMELTDKNNTGNYFSFDFAKESISDSLTPENKPSFSSILINWTPNSTYISDLNNKDSYQLYPNPTTETFSVRGDNIKEIEIRNINGKFINKSTSSLIDISKQANGIYIIKINTEKKIIMRKIIKK